MLQIISEIQRKMLPWLTNEQMLHHSSGRAVFATCLSDGETARWNREDFTGVLDDKFLPEWAREKLEELMTQEQTDAPTMGGMKMK